MEGPSPCCKEAFVSQVLSAVSGGFPSLSPCVFVEMVGSIRGSQAEGCVSLCSWWKPTHAGVCLWSWGQGFLSHPAAVCMILAGSELKRDSCLRTQVPSVFINEK